MSSSRIERKLAAIMFTDIAGYTESMSKSESKTLNLLEKKRSILKPLLKEYKGTFVKEIGDGTLSYFESAVNAATCAVKLQETTYDDKDMNIRVGIHIGDIVFKDGDVFGGGVNVASRLESIAPAGGVCVSKSVYDELSNQDDFDGIELGLQSLKGVGRLIEVFGLKGEKLNEPDPQKYQENKVAVHTDDEVPSIAIIPFDNKGKKEDAFYAYGISADLISDCSSAGLIRVAGLKEIEELGDIPFKEKAKKLSVRYVATGMLWKIDDMFQLSIELYDTKESKVVWSDRWQEKWDNLPTIKGSLSDGLLKALDTKPIIERRIETNNAEAYEYYLKAVYKYKHGHRQTLEDIEISKGLLKKAINLDNNLIMAKIELGWYYWESGDLKVASKIHQESFKQAQKLKDEYAIAGSLTAIAATYEIKGDYTNALGYFKKALIIREKLDDKSAMANSVHNMGFIYDKIGHYDMALEYHNKAYHIRNEINDIHVEGSLLSIGENYIRKEEFDKGLDYFQRALIIGRKLDNKANQQPIFYSLGYAYAMKGDYKNAIHYIQKNLKMMEDIDYNVTSEKLFMTILLFISYKNLNQSFDINDIYNLINNTENIEFDLNWSLFELLEDNSYLKIAYKQIQELADNLEPDVAAKFLSYPIPKAIVEEWEKVK